MTGITGQERPARLSEDLIEKLADAEHASWARWMDYLFSKCERGDDGSFIIPPSLAFRWLRQVETPYAGLSNREKQSDRDEVAHIVPFIAAEIAALRSERDAWKQHLDGASGLIREIDQDRDAWKARAERYRRILELDEAHEAKIMELRHADSGSIETLVRLAQEAEQIRERAYHGRKEALAEPQPPAEPDHPWFAWLPPSASVHRNCCDRPQSEHPPGDRLASREGAVMSGNAYRCIECGTVTSAQEVEIEGAGQWISLEPINHRYLVFLGESLEGPLIYCGPDCVAASMGKVKRSP